MQVNNILAVKGVEVVTIQPGQLVARCGRAVGGTQYWCTRGGGCHWPAGGDCVRKGYRPLGCRGRGRLFAAC